MTFVKTYTRPRQSILGIGYELVMAGSETDGGYELMRFLVPPQVGPPPHIHHLEDECFYLARGRLIVQKGDDSFVATAGDTAHLPRGIPHAFRNESDEFAEFLCWVQPATLEGFFAAFVQPWPAQDATPPPPQEQHFQLMMQAAQKHQIEMLM